MNNDEKIGMIFNPITGENLSAKHNICNETPYKIIRYTNKADVDIQFLDEHGFIKKHMDMRNLRRNSIKNPFQRTVYGLGYLGADCEKYPCYENGKDSIAYKKWVDMIRRCYNEKDLKRRPSYADCEVYEKWLNYSNFARWMEKNYYTLGDNEMHIDKDILYKGNKLYSPKRCVIVPKAINDLIVVPAYTNLPVGINLQKSGRYRSRVRYTFGNKTYCFQESFIELEDAIKYYNENKKETLIHAAKYYKKLFIKEYGIDAYKENRFKFKSLYKALINYEVY